MSEKVWFVFVHRSLQSGLEFYWSELKSNIRIRTNIFNQTNIRTNLYSSLDARDGDEIHSVVEVIYYTHHRLPACGNCVRQNISIEPRKERERFEAKRDESRKVAKRK